MNYVKTISYTLLFVSVLPIKGMNYFKHHNEKVVPHRFDSLDEEDRNEFNMVLDDAPARAKRILSRLQYPKRYPRWGYSFFLGAPGVGKTTLAQAIAYKAYINLGWDSEFFNCSDLLGEHRNSTAIHLKHHIETILEGGEDTIITIDELNKLFENYDNEHYDSDMTSATFWTLLDRIEQSKNIFLIGTMNSGEGLPQQIKDRARSRWIKFPDITNKKRVQMLKMRLVTANTRLDHACTDSVLKQLITKIDGWNPRSIKELALESILIERDKNPEDEMLIIKISTIIKAIETIKGFDDEVKYEKQQENTEERRHQELLKQNEDHFIKAQLINIQLQKGLYKPTYDLCTRILKTNNPTALLQKGNS